MPIEKEDLSFDFEEFKNKAIADMKAGRLLWVKMVSLPP